MNTTKDDDDGTNNVTPECYLFLFLLSGLYEVWQYFPYCQAEKYFDNRSNHVVILYAKSYTSKFS